MRALEKDYQVVQLERLLVCISWTFHGLISTLQYRACTHVAESSSDGMYKIYFVN